ncbi:MAG: family 10 glycosylhydrolase [Armatimonadota bacterium]
MNTTFRHMAIWFNGLPKEPDARQIVERLQAARIDNPFLAVEHEHDKAKIRDVIEEAHRAGLTVHSDFDELRCREGAPADLAQIIQDGTGTKVLCPANPAVVEYILDRLKRRLTAFDYDGITLDDGYYFTRSAVYDPSAPAGGKYQNIPSCYCAYCQSHAPIETPEWEQWKLDQVTDLIGKQAALARALKPGILFSAAAHMPYDRSYYQPYQQEIPYYEGWGSSQSRSGYLNDWAEWVRRGHIDFALPMIYYRSLDLVRWQTEECRQLLPDASKSIWVGLGLGTVTAEFYQGMSDQSGDRANDPAMQNDARAIETQLQDQLRMGQESVAFFCYSELYDEHLPVLARYR